MKKELDYFYIGDSFGGDQEWFCDPMMHLGGCAAATACDICIYLALRRNMRYLCPFKPEELDKKQYIRFSKVMKPYLMPRRNGVNRLDLYRDGFESYLEDVNDSYVSLEEFGGNADADQAFARIKSQIDDELPVAYLMLKHTDKELEDFVWHWFLVVGYEETEEARKVKTATYGEGLWLDFDNLWNTGYEEKGGMVLIHVNQ